MKKANLITGCLGLFGGIILLYSAGYFEEHWWLNDWIGDFRRSQICNLFGVIILIGGVVDLIVCFILANNEKQKIADNVSSDNSVSPNSDYSFRLNFDTFPEVRKDSWKCQCGTIHANYVGTCSCGKTKDEILAMERSKEEEKEAKEKAEVFVKAEVEVKSEEVKVKTESSEKEKVLLTKELEAANYDLLKKVKELYDAGVITQEEFESKKKQFLGL